MKILPISKKIVQPEIKYKRALRRINLEARDKLAEIEFYYPFDTEEKHKLILEVIDWLSAQKKVIHDRCFNPQPSFFQKFKNIFLKA